jgi:hypothetical protein
MDVKDLLVKLFTVRKVGVTSAEMCMVGKDHQLIHFRNFMPTAASRGKGSLRDGNRNARRFLSLKLGIHMCRRQEDRPAGR